MMLRCFTRLIGSTTHARRSATFIFSKNVAPRQLSNIIPAQPQHIYSAQNQLLLR